MGRPGDAPQRAMGGAAAHSRERSARAGGLANEGPSVAGDVVSRRKSTHDQPSRPTSEELWLLADALEAVARCVGTTVEALVEDPSLAIRDRDAARAALARVAEVASEMRTIATGRPWAQVLDDVIGTVPPLLRREASDD